jgi:prolyl-tRNA synthetase
LVRVREFTMKDSYSLDADWEGLDRQYLAHKQAYFNIFQRCSLPVIAVTADVGMMGGQMAHEFMYLTPAGEDTLLICSRCDYSANRQIATFQKPPAAAEPPAPLEKVATPGAKTIADLAAFLGVPEARTAKAVFYVAPPRDDPAGKPRFIFAVIRGDLEVNETKLANALEARTLRPALEDEIRSVGAEPGYASPVSLTPSGILEPVILVDDSIASSPNLVAGANEAGYHLLNTNLGRDYQADSVADIAAARAGDGCPVCGAPLTSRRGIEVGNIFKLGTRFSDRQGSNFTAEDGQEKPIIMGSYGIGVGRLLACIAEEHHDEKGLIWPLAVAPFQIHLVLLPGKGKGLEQSPSITIPGSQSPGTVEDVADWVYRSLAVAGIEVLFDERNESPGVKFNDADLLGIPIRLTVSERALAQGGVEFKRRDQDERKILPLDDMVALVSQALGELGREQDQG